MKKEYLIGLLTGCLLTASALMFIGATNGDSQIGKYQMSHSGSVRLIIDTRNGQHYKWYPMSSSWKKSGKPIQD